MQTKRRKGLYVARNTQKNMNEMLSKTEGKRRMSPNNKSRKRRRWKHGIKMYKVVSILTNK